MNTVRDPTELSLSAAKEALSKMLSGAYLDCFSVSSIQVSLKFINARTEHGMALYVDTNFSCEAALCNSDDEKIEPNKEDFFARRAKFLADVYTCIGKEVTNIALQPDGSLSIAIERSFIAIELSEEDMEQDESAWKVEMEAPPGHSLLGVKSVLCVPQDGVVSFLSQRGAKAAE